MEPEYIEQLRIDENRLEDEWVDQPLRFMRWAERAADARRNLDQAKLKLEVTEAELDLEIRKNPENYGLEKTTENAIKNTLTLQKKFQTARAGVDGCRYELEFLNQAVSAFDQRKKALENLVQLYSLGYFSNPKETNSEAARERIQKAKKMAARSRKKRGS